MLLSKQKGAKGPTNIKELVGKGNVVLKVTKKISHNAELIALKRVQWIGRRKVPYRLSSYHFSQLDI